jgi:hypothetical protein
MEQNARQMILDVEQLFAEGVTVTASGAIGSSVDLKGLGLHNGTVCVLVSALDVANADETYDIDIEVSTDNATWVKAGCISDVELKAVAASGAGRLYKPFHNQGSEMYKYVRLNGALAGTTPSMTITAFLSEKLV